MVRSGYMMSGSPVSWCQADGSWAPQWSQVSCLRYLQVFFLNLEKVFPNSRSCTYPGAVIHGTINPVMFYYKVSQTVTYKCSEVIITSFFHVIPLIFQQEFRLEGKPVLTCGKNGNWDSPIPTCVAKKIT